MKIFKKVIAIVMAIVLFACSFTGCVGGALEVDAADYLTKGEWFNYFVEETGLAYATKTLIELDESSPYYDAVLAIIDTEIIDKENAQKDLDDIVTKEVVAYTCVNYLTPGYRVNSDDVEFKDADSIVDVEAAKIAVKLGFVEPKSKSKFGPNEYMSIEECGHVFDKMVDHLVNYEGDGNNDFDIVYQDNVYDTGAEILEVLQYNVDIEDKTELEVSDDTSVSFMGLRNPSDDVNIINTATSSDEIIVSITEKTYKENKEAYEVGNIIKFQEKTVLDTRGLNREVVYIKITQKPERMQAIRSEDGSMNCYIIKGTLPTTDETIKAIDSAGPQKNKSSSIKQVDDGDSKNIGPITITNNSIEFTYNGNFDQKIDLNNGRSDKTDPTLSGKVNANIKVSDFCITTDGFNTIFTDVLFGKPNASITVSYTTSVNGELQIPQTRVAPYNNGNGKFASNLMRSRPTTGNGAQDIKIGKFQFRFGPLIATFRLGLQIHFDGTISISVTKDSNTTYTIKKSGISSTSKSNTNTELKAEVNLYVGVELKGDLALIGFPKTPIIDCRAGAGFDIMLNGAVYIVDKKESATKIADSNYSGDELSATCKQSTELRYCIGVKAQFKLYGAVSESDCIVRKVVRLATGNKNFSGWYRELEIAMGEFHFEDGKVVDSCTRVTKDDDTVKVVAGDKFDISTYNLIADSKEPVVFYITEIPCSSKNLDKINKGLNVKSKDNKICKATYFSDSHKVVVEPKSAGTTHVEISTPKGKYTMLCSITVNAQKEMSLEIQDIVETEIMYI